MAGRLERSRSVRRPAGRPRRSSTARNSGERRARRPRCRRAAGPDACLEKPGRRWRTRRPPPAGGRCRAARWRRAPRCPRVHGTRPGEPLAHQPRQVAAVVEVGVAQHHGVDRRGVAPASGSQLRRRSSRSAPGTGRTSTRTRWAPHSTRKRLPVTVPAAPRNRSVPPMPPLWRAALRAVGGPRSSRRSTPPVPCGGTIGPSPAVGRAPSVERASERGGSMSGSDADELMSGRLIVPPTARVGRS